MVLMRVMCRTDMALVQDKKFKPWVQKYADDEQLFFKEYVSTYLLTPLILIFLSLASPLSSLASSSSESLPPSSARQSSSRAPTRSNLLVI